MFLAPLFLKQDIGRRMGWLRCCSKLSETFGESSLSKDTSLNQLSVILEVDQKPPQFSCGLLNKRIISLISKGKIYPLVRVPLWSPSENVRVWPCSYSRQSNKKLILLPKGEQGRSALRELKSALIWSLKFPLGADFKLNGSQTVPYAPVLLNQFYFFWKKLFRIILT